MQEDEFRAWLQRGGYSPSTVATELTDLRRIESAYGDLDAAYDADGLAAIMASVTYSQADERAGRANPSRLPLEGRLLSSLAAYRNALRYYLRFKNGEPSRRRGQPPSEDDVAAELDGMIAVFRQRMPGFRSFADRDGHFWQTEGRYKQDAREKLLAAISNAALDEEACGREIYKALVQGTQEGLPLSWRTADEVAKAPLEVQTRFYETVARLARLQPDDHAGLTACAQALEALRGAGVATMKRGEVLCITISVFGTANPAAASWFKVRLMEQLARRVLGRGLFGWERFNIDEFIAFQGLMNRIRERLADEGWAPNSLFDVQGFVWVVLDEGYAVTDEDDATAAVDDDAQPTLAKKDHVKVTAPINLILHGPPGTGKTYATAAKALQLCGAEIPDDRDALMARYRQLQEEGRIEFVTFHQSMSYEDFIEGRQPTTGGEGDDGDSGGTGFRLETVPGIFRRIARRAEISRGKVAGEPQIAIGSRQVVKTSIGAIYDPAEDYLFEEAIAGGYTLLGFDDIDWSDDKYGTREAIIAACQAADGTDTPLNGMHARVQMPFIFRNWVKPGDIIIVSKGTGLFRAIGEVIGGYEFHPRPEGGYAHRRKVRWLWVDRAGVPVSEIYQRKFSMRTIYLLYSDQINVPALERYMNSQLPSATVEVAPEPFVLVIDEINRANISKVFGELITLLEPDKRIGQTNELRVQLPYSGDRFGVPSNLHILGTMNTADRSIALLDTALRRRFTFEEVMPDPEVLATEASVPGVDLPAMLRTLNERVEYLFDREHQIGHAYFVGCNSQADLDDRMRHRVIPLLAEYFHGDMAKVAAVLGDPDGERFLERKILKRPPGFEDDGPDVVRWIVRSEFSKDAYDGLK